MKNFKYFKSICLIALLALTFTSCEEDVESPVSNFVGFEIGTLVRPITVTNNSTETFDVKVYATETTSSDRTFNVVVDMDETTLASPFSVPAQVTIPGGTNEGTLTFSVTDNDDLGFVAQTLVFGFEDQGSPQVTYSVAEECLDTIVTFALTLDTWPDETTWEIFDLSGTPTVIFSGGPYVNPDDDFAELSFDFCLASGNYGVVVYDSYGDGGPTFGVTAGGATLVPDTTVAGSQSSATFTVQ
ncbi:hypothetical protein [Winogradskyella sp.]|uniref:hypothetical protein n=1 Tax=Winogradskyella sp. TaxID=1883156 RepID=UPI003BA91FCC